MKTALVLGGGGAKGAFQAGVISQLLPKLQVDIVCGTSAGAINAAGVAFCGPARLLELWESIRSWRDLFSLNLGALVMRADGILDPARLRAKIEKACDGGLQRCALSLSKVRLEDGRLMFSNPSVDVALVDEVMASCAIPGLIDPVVDAYTDDHYVDGGVRENVPLKRAIELGADRVVVVLCNPWAANLPRWKARSSGWFGFIDNTMRALDITYHEILVNDINTCLDMNNDPKKKKIEVVIYAPQFEPCGTLEFEPEAIRKAIALGKIAKPIVLSRGGVA